MKARFSKLLGAVLLLTANSGLSQGTAFTYQGRLNEGTGPANGTYDFRFAIWDAPTNGTQAGGLVTNQGTILNNGLFSVVLDFGNVFDGGERWLEPAVKTNGATTFTTLLPRQRLTASPYAVFAGGANAAGLVGSIPATSIGANVITSNMLAPGAAAANLAASGQGIVPSGGIVLSASDNDTNLLGSGFTSTGGYVNAPNLWRQRSPSPVLAGREGQATVWTGSRIIVWGGYCGNENPNVPPPITYFSDGGCYDPDLNSWTEISTNGSPISRKSFTAVWTGGEMIIWGGYTWETVYHYFGDGARYSPGSNSWAAVAANNAPSPRARHTAVWTGTELIIWGGIFHEGAGSPSLVYSNGARYNPVSNTWSPVALDGAPTARFDHTAIWTGSEMIVWGGQNGDGSGLGDGRRYDPTTDTWSPMLSATGFLGRSRHTAVWTGSEMIVWGGFSGGGPYEQSGGRYNPVTDTWSLTDESFAPTGRVKHTAIWTGREMMIWGGECANPVPHCNDGGSYDPVSNTWTPVTAFPRAPSWRVGHSAVWTGSEMIVCYGDKDAPDCLNDIWSCAPPRSLYLYLRK